MSSPDPGSARPPHDLFALHVVERPFWQTVTEAVEAELKLIVAHRRIAAKVEARAKSSGSVFGKAHRKPDTYYHLGAFGDLAAARVLVPFISDVDGIADEIHADPHFEVLEDDSKASAPDRLAYQARHLDVLLSDELIGARPASAEGRQIRCEIQIHTFAQSLWANMSHLITYKRADLPEEIERRVFRLVALCELFDSEADLSQKLVAQDIDHAERLASELQRHFYALTGVEHDIDQSVSLVARLLGAISGDERQQYPAHLESFVDEFAVRLTRLLTDRPEARGIPWLLRPEALLIFERLTHAPQSLQATWEQTFPTTELDRLRDAWGPVD